MEKKVGHKHRDSLRASLSFYGSMIKTRANTPAATGCIIGLMSAEDNERHPEWYRVDLLTYLILLQTVAGTGGAFTLVTAKDNFYPPTSEEPRFAPGSGTPLVGHLVVSIVMNGDGKYEPERNANEVFARAMKIQANALVN